MDAKLESEPQRVTRVRIARGIMTHTSEVRESKTYRVRNEDTKPRSVIIEHLARPGWKLAADALKPEETSAGLYRFRLSVAPKTSTTLTISEARQLDTRYELTNLTGDQLAVFIRQRAINPDAEQALRRILEQRNRVATIEKEVEKRKEETNEIFDDQQRLRENLKALKGSAEERALSQRYTQQLANQETRLETLRREMADLENKRQQGQAELDAMIQQLALDVGL